jgi:cytochrome c-type biogenesis protein CcmH
VSARRALRGLAAAVLLISFAVPWVVAQADAVDDGVRRIALQLQCPVCEGQSAADSPSGLASDMRAVIRAKLLAGETDQQVLDYFVAAYGDGILTEPPKRGISLGVWLGPVVALALGTLLVAGLLRAWRSPRLARRAEAVVDPAVDDELRSFREGFGR